MDVWVIKGLLSLRSLSPVGVALDRWRDEKRGTRLHRDRTTRPERKSNMNRKLVCCILCCLAAPLLAAISATPENGKPESKSLIEALVGDDPQKALTLLRQGIDANQVQANGLSPIMVASAKGFDEVVAALIAKGAKVNAKDVKGKTALQMAAFGGHKKSVEALLSAGADVNLADADGVTPLIAACINNRIEIVQLLVGKKANVDAQTKAGGTALMAASAYGHTEIVALLLASGADTSLQASNGQTALSVAKLNHQDAIVALLTEKTAPKAQKPESLPNGSRTQTSESTDWKEAAAKDTLEAYATFLRQYPDSKMKQEVRTATDRLITEAVKNEIEKNNAEISRKGVRGTAVVPIGNWVGSGATFTITAGELPLGDSGFVILSDPTAPLVFTGVSPEQRTVLRALPYD
jgi:ankyrin repeat protein